MANISKYVLFFFSLLSIIGCKKEKPETAQNNNTLSAHERLFSKTVGDTFSISISLPEGYDAKRKKNYPVVYLLDANLYFDIVAASYKKYAEIGIVKPVILVGIGYKSLAEMDSLRCRDYTYPKALPEYEMAESGGADKFLSFLDKELLPHIDRNYRTDTGNRVLMGHSLGGYFTSYALVQQLSREHNLFSGYIAASPSLHYNNYYLLNKLKELKRPENTPALKTYFTYGGAEDDENDNEPGLLKTTDEAKQLSAYLNEQVGSGFMVDIYSGLGHFDTPTPTFIKGLQWCLRE